MTPNYRVEADHPTLKRIDKYFFNISIVNEYKKELEELGYEDIEIITLGETTEEFTEQACLCISKLKDFLNGDHDVSIIFENKDDHDKSFVFTNTGIDDIKATLDIIKKNNPDN